jgi:hypothetical protein
MREIEFVPEWYAATHRRKRLVRLQLLVTIVMAAALATWGYVNSQTVVAAEDRLFLRQQQLAESENRVRERQEQQKWREQLQTQERVDSSLGLNIESSRLLALIDTSMPKFASLLELSIETDEKARSLAQHAAARKTAAASPNLDRRITVNLKGVAPTNGDIATLYENLSATGFCEDLRLNYAKDRLDGNHIMREFVIQFSINLNADGGAL